MSRTSTKFARIPIFTVILITAHLAARTAQAVTVAPVPIKPVLYFSTDESFVANRGPYAGQTISPGDLLTSTGLVIRNAVLTRNFDPMPPGADYGLDGLAIPYNSQILFSTDTTFFDQKLGRYVGHGDLLSDQGTIVQTNGQLLRNFLPPTANPVYHDYGLDGVVVPAVSPAAAANVPPNILFSTEESFYSPTLGRNVGHGDILSTTGKIFATNAQLLKNFHPSTILLPPTPADYGLDGFGLQSNSEIWFTTQTGFFDSGLNRWVGDGDLLSTTGQIVLTNQQLVAPFLIPTTSNVPHDYGLDAFWMSYLPVGATAGPAGTLAAENGPGELGSGGFASLLPEPASGLLLGVGLLLIGRRRRTRCRESVSFARAGGST